MTAGRWALLSILSLITLILIALFIWVFVFLKNPPQIPCPAGWDKNCSYILEKYYDESIDVTKPLPLYLGDFEFKVGEGPPLCKPMWYAFRYVRLNDGGFGSLGPWTDKPVFANAPTNGQNCNLPCPGQNCPVDQDGNSKYCGPVSCNFNHPVMGTVDDLGYSSQKDGVYANVHRYIGTDDTTPPPIGEEGEIVGILLPSSSYALKSMIVDVLYNPNTQGATCSGC